jgi:hypothetical protein
MTMEDELKRNVPPFPYKPGTVRLFLPLGALKATRHLLQLAGGREAGAMWYGPKDADGNGTVSYVVAPRQRMRRGNYHVSAEALAEVIYRLPEGYKPLAQVHSHPGKWVEHSSYDETMVSSQRILSLVFPFYGRQTSDFPHGIGVHEWQDGYWHCLDLDSAMRRISLANGEVRVEDMR